MYRGEEYMSIDFGDTEWSFVTSFITGFIRSKGGEEEGREEERMEKSEREEKKRFVSLVVI